MKHNIYYPSGSLKGIKLPEGETIEVKISRIVNNREPISDGVPMFYMDRSAGVQPAYDIRSDRFDIALDAMDKATGMKIAMREKRMEDKKVAESKSTAGTEQGNNPAA